MSLKAFLPIDRFHALAQHRDLPTLGSGVVLFADISGFTSFTELLVLEYGAARGCELLSQHLNRVYEALVTTIHYYGGSVINFAGDSITCWFSEGNNTALRAVTAALKMQTVMQQKANTFTVNGKVANLAIKIAVGSGAVHRFVAGDPAIQRMELLAGAVVNEVLEAESLAKRGETLVTEEICTELGDNLQTNGRREDVLHSRFFSVITGLKTLADPCPWPDLPDDSVAEAELRAWTLAAIYERVNLRLTEYLTELRPAVAMFLRFDGLDYEVDSDANYKLNAYIQWAQNIINKYGGSLLQIVLEHKGNYFYATFGAPLSHNNDVERAIRAALALRKMPEEFSWIESVQIGLTYGKMRTGIYGGTERYTYGVLGDEVNLAARLMQASQPGQILVSKAVRNIATDSPFQWESLPPLQLKGKDKSVSVYKLIEAAASRSNPEPTPTTHTLVGRKKELQFIQEKLELYRLGCASTVVIEGEPGIGKSQLLRQVTSQAKAMGLPVLTGSTDTVEQTEPFYVWKTLINQLLDLDEHNNLELRQSQVQQRLEKFVPELLDNLPLLNAVLALNFPESKRTIQMSGQVRADNTQEFLLTLLHKAVPKQGLVIVLEDAHWLDSASRGLGLAVVQNIPSIFLILSTRPPTDLTTSEFLQKLQEAGAYRLVLEGLGKDDILELLYQKLGVSALPQPILDLVVNKTQGNPFFSEELIYALRDSEIITVNDQQCELTKDNNFRLETLDLPDTVQGVITNRIDKLNPYQQTALKTASVIGRSFKFQVLYDIYPLADNKSNLENCLTQLTDQDITFMEVPPPDPAYLFKHIIVQEVVYNLMPFEQRRQMHQLVALWFENHFSANLIPYYSLLAYHWEQAEETAKAIEYLQKAGEQALKNGIYPEAVNLYSRLLQLIYRKNSNGEKLDQQEPYWLKQLGVAYVGCGDLQEARKHLEKALKLLELDIPSRKKQLIIGSVKESVKQLIYQSNLIKPRLKTGKELERVSLAIEIMAPLHQIYMFGGKNLQMLYCVMRRANLAESTTVERYLFASYLALSMINSSIGLHKLAHKYIVKAQDKVAKMPNLLFQGKLAACQATYYANLGNFKESEQTATKAVEYFQQLGDKREIGINSCVAALSLLYQGKYLQTVQLYRQIYEVAANTNDVQLQIWSKFGILLGLTRAGNLEKAEAELEEALPLLAQIPSEIEKSSCYSTLALFYLHKKDYDQAYHYAEMLSGIMSKVTGRTFGFVSGYCAVLEVSLTLYEQNLQQYAKIFKMMRPVAGKLKSFGKIYPAGAIYSWFYRGRYEALAGHTKKALSCWYKALALSQKLDLPYEQALLHQYIADYLPSSHPDYSEHLERSKLFFSRLEMNDFHAKPDSLHVAQLATSNN